MMRIARHGMCTEQKTGQLDDGVLRGACGAPACLGCAGGTFAQSKRKIAGATRSQRTPRPRPEDGSSPDDEDRWSWGRLSQTKYHLRRTPSRVTVIRNHHPLQGEEFEVLMEGNERIVIRVDDGTSMRIRRRWTNADGDPTDQSLGGNTVFSIDSLRRVIELVEVFAQRT